MQEIATNKFNVKINNVDYTANIPFPLKWSSLLDEQLDEGSLAVLQITEKNFPPLSDVEININNGAIIIRYLVANDKADETPVGSGKYNHELYLIEETKFLECFVCRSQGYTNSLAQNYAKLDVLPRGYVYQTNNDSWNNADINNIFQTFQSPRNNFTLVNGFESLVKASSSLGGGWKGNPAFLVPKLNTQTEPKENEIPKITIFFGNRKIYETSFTYTIYSLDYFSWDLTSGNADINVEDIATEEGIYKINYHNCSLVKSGEIEPLNITDAEYTFVYIKEQSSKPKWNARTICERALAIAETLRVGETPRFQLDEETAIWLEQFETPEFHFTQSTLREILQTIGHFVHCEPRLSNGKIYFDKFGQDTITTPTFANRYGAKSYTENISNYVTNLHSNVDNFVNSIGYAKGVITEPYAKGFKTLRTENVATRLENENVLIETKYPIRNIVKLRVGILENGDGRKLDISSYVFEATDYARLSSYESAYPFSKDYAIYYTTGQKNIYGLNFKQPKIIFQSFGRYSIVNIINAVYGLDLSTINLQELAFEVTYEPIYSAVAQQSKSCIIGYNKPSTMVYNQNQNIVESHYYGENLKGVISRLGNVDKVMTFVVDGIPNKEELKVGTIWEEDNEQYYVSAIATEVQPYYTKMSVSLSKDFNRYSDYVGIDSVKRFYEISEKQAYDSHITYKDYVVLGDNNYTTFNDGLLNLSAVMGIITQQPIIKPINYVLATGRTKDNKYLPTILLAVQTASIGNSALFVAKYEDNFSAGKQVEKVEIDNAISYFQQGTPYCDYFGDIEYLDLDYKTIGFVATDYEEQTKIGMQIPSFDSSPTQTDYITTGQNPLIIKKSGTEIPTIDYQVDFVTNKENIIIGSAFPKTLQLIDGNNGVRPRVYALKEKLNKFTKKVDITTASDLGELKAELLSGEIRLVKPQTTPNGYIAYAVLNNDNELIFGSNIYDENLFDGYKLFIKHDIFN